MDEVELLVVGAGFAGLACAKAAAVRGVSTRVIEAKRDIGFGVRTTGILVKELADSWDMPHQLTRKIAGARLYSPGLRMIDLVSPGYYFLATDTPNLLRWLARQAAGSGVEIQYDSRYLLNHSGEDSCLFRNGRQATQELRYRYLVGSDGARSRVARTLGLGRNHAFLAGGEYELQGDCGVDPNFLHMFLDSHLAPGYIAWIVPGVGVTQIGLAARRPARSRE